MATTVILGTGIIGVSTAYYLTQTQPASTIHLVEPSPTLFASASGFAGGFLAKDWFSASVAAVGALSFTEHRNLAETFGGRKKWGYARSCGLSHRPGRGEGKRGGRGRRGEDWLREGASRAEAVAGEVSGVVGEGVGDEAPRWLRRGEGDVVEGISEEGSTAQMWASRITLPYCTHRLNSHTSSIVTHYDSPTSSCKPVSIAASTYTTPPKPSSSTPTQQPRSPASESSTRSPKQKPISPAPRS